MARRKSGRARRFFGRARKFYRKHSPAVNPIGTIFTGAIYGAVRAPLHNATAPITNMLPLGQYSDEAAYGLAGYLMATSGNSMLKSAGTAILTIEAASAGAQLTQGMIGGQGSSQPTIYL